MNKAGIERLLALFQTCTPEEKPVILRSIEKECLNDKLMRDVDSLNGFSIIAQTFINGKVEEKNSIISVWRSLLQRSQLVRFATITTEEEVIENIASYMKETKVMAWKIQAAGIILCLAGLKCDNESILYATDYVLFPSIKGEHGEFEKRAAIDCILKAAAIEESRPILLEIGTKDVIQTSLDYSNPDMNFVGCLIQSLLSMEDPEELYKTNPRPSFWNIERVLKAVSIFASTTATAISTLVGFTVDCSIILLAVRSLAMKRETANVLKEKNIVPKLIDLLQNRKENLLKENMETVEQLAKAIWMISFDSECKEHFISLGVVELLKEFPFNDSSKGMKEAIQGTLFHLTGQDPLNILPDDKTSKEFMDNEEEEEIQISLQIKVQDFEFDLESQEQRKNVNKEKLETKETIKPLSPTKDAPRYRTQQSVKSDVVEVVDKILSTLDLENK